MDSLITKIKYTSKWCFAHLHRFTNWVWFFNFYWSLWYILFSFRRRCDCHYWCFYFFLPWLNVWSLETLNNKASKVAKPVLDLLGNDRIFTNILFVMYFPQLMATLYSAYICSLSLYSVFQNITKKKKKKQKELSSMKTHITIKHNKIPHIFELSWMTSNVLPLSLEELKVTPLATSNWLWNVAIKISNNCHFV